MPRDLNPEPKSDGKVVFLSFNLEHETDFVQRVAHYLRRQPDTLVYVYDQHEDGDRFNRAISEAMSRTTHFVFIKGEVVGDYQENEALRFFELRREDPRRTIVAVDLDPDTPWPPGLGNFHIGIHAFQPALLPGESKHSERVAHECAVDIARTMHGKWIPYDGVPPEYIFHYEKDIIAQFACQASRPANELLLKGCPESWPTLQGPDGALLADSPLRKEDIGSFRSRTDTVLVDVRSQYHRPASACAGDQAECCLAGKALTFLEAGPRQTVVHGQQPALNVGIVVSGGIAPGINAVIAGIVDRHLLYYTKRVQDQGHGYLHALAIHGYRDGFRGVVEGRQHLVAVNHLGDVQPHFNSALAFVLNNANEGGSMLGTSRFNPLADRADLDLRNDTMALVLNALQLQNIDILYVIGGDGSMKAAHAIHVLNEDRLRQHVPNARRMTVVGIPKTMDNDILWVWQSFGFMSAVEKAAECIQLLQTEAESNPRLCVVQLFGSDSGFTVSHAALASLNCDAALIPEMDFDMEGLFQHVRNRLEARLLPVGQQSSPFGMVVLAETAVPTDWYRYVNWPEHLARKNMAREDLLGALRGRAARDFVGAAMERSEPDPNCVDFSQDEVDAVITFVADGRRVYGETPDALRRLSLKLVSQVLQRLIQERMGRTNPFWSTFRVFTSEPRHLLRSSPPSASDIITGRRFGTLAVDNAMAGYTDFMISQWLTEYVLVPLSLVVLGRKRVPKSGIFWKSVLAKTEQWSLDTDTSAKQLGEEPQPDVGTPSEGADNGA